MSLRGAGHDRYFAFEIAHRLLLFRWRTERPAHYARLLSGRQFDNYRTTVPNRSSERGEKGFRFSPSEAGVTPSCCIFDSISRLGDFSMSSSLSPIFRLALAVFIPWRGLTDLTGAAGMAPALMVCWTEGGAGFYSLLAFCSGGAVELPGRSRSGTLASSPFGGVGRVNHSRHPHARAMRRFQIAVSFLRFRSATESTAPRSDGAGRADRAGGGARRRATPWPPKAARASRSLSVGAWLPRAAPDQAGA